MNINEALIASSPAYLPSLTVGSVMVGPLLTHMNSFDWTRLYLLSNGAAMVGWRALRGDAALIALLSHALELLVFDGIRPDELHREFMKIDEYRSLLGAGATGYEFNARQEARLHYFHTIGTSECGRGALTQNKAVIATLSYAVQLLVLDGVTPDELHNEFMKVAAYQKRFGSCGIPFAPGRFAPLINC